MKISIFPKLHGDLLNTTALFLLYDVTNRKSYDNTRAWLAEINEYAHRDVIIMLLGNTGFDCKTILFLMAACLEESIF